MNNCSNHKKEIAGITDANKLARMTCNAHYEFLAEYFDEIAKWLKEDSLSDAYAGKTNLSIFLEAASNNMRFAASQIVGAWKVSKPFME